MYTPELIAGLHSQLQTSLPSTTVLLGGSYAYNEANEGSDVDFYVVLSSWQLVLYPSIKKAIALIKDNNTGVRINVMLVPRILFERGFYYIHGVDTSGNGTISATNTKAFVTTTLKLALLHYIYFATSNDTHIKKQELGKFAQRVAALLITEKGLHTFKPMLSTAYLVSSLHPQGSHLEKVLLNILNLKHAAENFTTKQQEDFAQTLLQYCQNVYANNKKTYFGFWWLSYCIYMAHFWRARERLFLTKNPDTLVLDLLFETIKQGPLTMLHNKKRIERIIFPVLII